MPDLAQTIVVSGGIGSGSPFLVGHIPVITQVQPPLIADTIATQVTSTNADGFAILVGTVDGAGSPQEGLRTTLGLVTEQRGQTGTIIIGRAASAAGGSCIAIGTTSSSSNSPASVVVGSSASSNGNGVAIGTNAVHTSTSSLGGVAIGFGATTATTHNGAVAIGDNAKSDSGVCIGTGNVDTTAGTHRNILIGNSNKINGAFTDCIILSGTDTTGGNGAHANASGQILIGVNNLQNITNAACVVINGDAASTDIGAGGWQFGGRTYPLATLVLGQGDLVAATNPGPAVTVRVTNAQGLNQNGGTLTIIGSRSTGTGVGGGIVFQTGVTGASSSTLNALATALTIADGTQIATLQKRLNVIENAATGAVALTLTNGPATATAGPPQFYIRMQVNGTNVVVPAWTA